jgi:hypothetical protein
LNRVDERLNIDKERCEIPPIAGEHCHRTSFHGEFLQAAIYWRTRLLGSHESR